MEFISARLAENSEGKCETCQRNPVVLEAVIMHVKDDSNRRNALGEPIKVGEKAHLICGECATNHPLWKITNETPEEAVSRTR